MASNPSSRGLVPMANKYDRVILLVDMDCFYCQVEEKLEPSLKGQPLAVVQYNAWRGGGIIAVNYAARAKGVTRHMRGDEAKAQCPEIQLIKVPNVREKADLTKYREAGKEVANVLQRFTPLLERASVDEAYLDITDAVNKRLVQMNEGTFILQPTELVNTYAVGFDSIGEYVTTITNSYTNPSLNNDEFYDNFSESDRTAVRSSNIQLLIGASIASEIRAAVKADTSYECSAGIAHNKILAKLACGMKKPNKQTILPLSEIPKLFETLPLGKIKGLGAKFGEDVCEKLGIRFLGQMLRFSEAELQKNLMKKMGISWLFNICRGIDLEAVTPRFNSKSIGCCKKFPGRNNITGIKTLQHWLSELANEISDRLNKDIDENNRRAKQMVVNFIQEINSEEISNSRSGPLTTYDPDTIARCGLEIIKTNTKQFYRSGSESILQNPIKFLGFSVGKFEPISSAQHNIQAMFAQQAAKKRMQTELCPQENIQNDSVQSNSKPNELLKKEETQKAPNKLKNDIKTLFSNTINKKVNQSKENNFPNDQQNCNYINQNPVYSVVKEETAVHPSPKSFFKKRFKNKCPLETIVAPMDQTNLTMNNSSDIQEVINEDSLSSTEVNEELKPKDIIEGGKEELDCLLTDLKTLQKDTENANCSETANSSNSETDTLVRGEKRKYSDVAELEETKTDYRTEYVEYAAPQFQPDLIQYINCSKCSAKISNDNLSIQIHDDHHIAQELSQTQRIEFREQMNQNVEKTSRSPKSTHKKTKLSPKNNCKKTINENIRKFLRPTESFLDTSIAPDTTDEMEICEICKLPIKLDEVTEHKDFHVAKELQRKLNQLEVHTVEVTKKTLSEASRKKLNTTIVGSQAKTNAKAITQFFFKPNR